MRVLYVATDLRDADVLQQEVKKAAPKLVFDVCAGASEARARVDRSLGYDVMLLDSSVAEPDQLQLVQHVRSKQIPLPIALLANQSTAPPSAVVSAVDECITRGPRLGERLGPGLRLAIERYRVVSTTLRDNERLKRSEARLRLIIEALPAGVLLVDQSGKILAMNLAGSTLVGTSGPSDVVGREVYSLTDAEGAQRLRELVTRALSGERGRADFTCHGPDGVPRLLSVEALCIQRDEAGQGSVLGVLSMSAPEATGAEAGVEFAFSGDAGAPDEERAALEQTLETMRGDVERLETEVTSERGRVQQLLAELERARATSAEHHAQRAALDERSRVASARLEEIEGRQREEQAAMEAAVSRVASLTDEAGGLRQERQRLAHESDALKQELLEQRRARLELEERIAAADIERERLTTVLAAAQSASESRGVQFDQEIQSLKASIGAMTARERTLAAELDATKFEASRLRDDLGRESETRARFEADLERARGELQTALSAQDGDRASFTGRLADLQAALEASSAREQALRAELDGATAERARIEQINGDLQTSLDARQADYANAASRLADLQASLDAAVATEQSLRAEIDAVSADRIRIEQAHSDLQASFSTRDADHTAAVSRLSDLQAAFDAALATERTLRAEIDAAAAQRFDVEGRLAQASQRVSELEQALGEATAREQGLTAEVASLGDVRTQLDAGLAELAQRASALDASLAAKTSELEGLSAELAAARFETGQVRDDLARESEARARVESDLEARSFDLSTLQTSMEADRDVFQARIAELETDLTATRDREQALELRTARITELEAAIAEMEARRQTAVARIAELEGDLSATRDREQALELRTARITELEAAIAEMEARRQTAVARIAELEGDLSATRDREQALELRTARIAELEAAIAEVEERRQMAVARIAELEGDLSATRDRERALELRTARIVDLEASISEMEGRRQAAVARIVELEGDLSATRDRERALELRTARITELEASISEMEGRRQAAVARIVELESDLSATRDRERGLELRTARITELEASISEMEARRQAAVARVAELEERRRDEQSALAAAAQREADLAQELLSARDEHTRLVEEREGVAGELTRERDTRRAVEGQLSAATTELHQARKDLEARLAAHETELARLRGETQATAQALIAEKESASRVEREGREAAAQLEAELARAREGLEQAAERESTLASELAAVQHERDGRGRQAFELETMLAREREERIDIQSRLQVLEREAADAGARADARVAEMARDHQEVVARLQKLLEQAAAREFQAAALSRPSPSDRIRRRPAEKIGQLAAAMANDLNASIADVAEDARRLLSELPDGTTSRARAEQTLQTANRAGQLVRHLLRLSERESRLIPRVEVSGLVRSNEALLRQLAGADIELKFELAGGLPHVECDAEEVVQVLSTLIVTVRGALPLGGVIRVTTQERGRHDGRRRNDQTLVLTVSAEGYGMIPVATAVCEEVVTRCGGTFSALVDASTSTTSLQAALPAEARNAEAAPGWSQTA